MKTKDPFNLSRFVDAQRGEYDQALEELKAGCKSGHWIWYVLPQLRGLGFSHMSTFYGIVSLDEARAYLAHPVLGARYRECVEAITAHPARSVSAILGQLDAQKFRSSLTLFTKADPENTILSGALSQCFGGKQDDKTLSILAGV